MIYLNIGSNLSSPLGDRFDNILYAIKHLLSQKIKIKKISSFFETPSYPNKTFPKFINISLEIYFTKNPKILLSEILKIEKKIYRIRSIKNASRTCDIDIIDYNGKILNSKNLILPHPSAHLRNFVLIPLREIAPNWIHPLLNQKIDILIRNLSLKSRNEITRIE